MGARRETLSGAERSQLWERWRAGDSVAEIARALRRTYKPVYSHLSHHGGIEPRRRHRRTCGGTCHRFCPDPGIIGESDGARSRYDHRQVRATD
jgi:hypothetical protein